jgi:hypothetical protein
VAQACNPSYSGGRDQEDHGSKSAWVNSLQDPISKNPSKNRAGGVVQGEGPQFKPQYCKIKKKCNESQNFVQLIYSYKKGLGQLGIHMQSTWVYTS